MYKLTDYNLTYGSDVSDPADETDATYEDPRLKYFPVDDTAVCLLPSDQAGLEYLNSHRGPIQDQLYKRSTVAFTLGFEFPESTPTQISQKHSRYPTVSSKELEEFVSKIGPTTIDFRFCPLSTKYDGPNGEKLARMHTLLGKVLRAVSDPSPNNDYYATIRHSCNASKEALDNDTWKKIFFWQQKGMTALYSGPVKDTKSYLKSLLRVEAAKVGLGTDEEVAAMIPTFTMFKKKDFQELDSTGVRNEFNYTTLPGAAQQSRQTHYGTAA